MNVCCVLADAALTELKTQASAEQEAKSLQQELLSTNGKNPAYLIKTEQEQYSFRAALFIAASAKIIR